jgi:hypothetical protein
VIALMFARDAAASPSSNPGQVKSAAQAKLVEGVERLKSERYQEALDCFKEAYALIPSPLISYDLGLAYLGLGDDPAALQSFDEFLNLAPQAPADKRHRAEAYRDQLRPKVATVDLIADVEGGDLTVDGRGMGSVSLPRRLYLAPGSHELILRAGVGGARQSRTVVCGAGETCSVALRFSSSSVPSVATTAVSASPPLSLAAPPPVEAGGAPVVIQPRSSSVSPDTHAHPSGLRLWGVGTAAAGLGALGAGMVFGLMAKNDGDALSQDAQSRRNFIPETEAAGLHHQRLETVFFSVGAVAILAGVGLYAISRYGERASHATGQGIR